MKVLVQSSTLLKPSYNGNPPPTTEYVPLSPFDRVTDDAHIAVLFAYRPPTPPNSLLASTLATVLGAAYREWAGRLGKDDKGNPIIILNDKGVRFVEAFVDDTHDNAVPSNPSPEWLKLHPSPDGIEELFQVQLTRFNCGTLIIGFTMYHGVADGLGTSNFLVAWTRTCRGLNIGTPPVKDRKVFFRPRSPRKIQFEHLGVELKAEKFPTMTEEPSHDNVGTQKTHFSKEFLNKLRAAASSGSARRYSTFDCLVAHLWRAMARARGLPGNENTHVRISVNGRERMNPRIPNEYFGNLILWAYPRAKVRELVSQPLRYAAELIHSEVAKVDDSYFKSFIDFASSETAEGLVPTVDPDQWVLAPNIDVDCWLRFPIREMDFGGGAPFYFVPSYYPVEGLMFLVPSFGEGQQGGVDAYVSLFEDDLATFRQICYSSDHDDDEHKELYAYKWGKQKDLLMARL